MSKTGISAAPITIEAIGIDRREVLANLAQFYVYDFSELYPDKPELEFEPNGRFGDLTHLDKYFSEPGRVALLIRSDEAIIGFALLNQVSDCREQIDFNMAEFFIARKYRRRSYGNAAAHAVFAAYRGEWELSVARPNVAGQKFWSLTLNSLPKLSPLREIAEPSSTWAVTYRFRT